MEIAQDNKTQETQESTEQKETSKEFAERKRAEKKQMIDANGRNASVVVTETYESRELIRLIEDADRAIKDMRLKFGRPNGPTLEQLIATTEEWNQLVGGLKTFVGRIRKGKFSSTQNKEATAQTPVIEQGVETAVTTTTGAVKEDEKAKKEAKKADEKK